MSSTMRESSIFESIFGPTAQQQQADVRAALLRGYEKGFTMARDRIADMLEEEGKAQTALKIRKLKLCRK